MSSESFVFRKLLVAGCALAAFVLSFGPQAVQAAPYYRAAPLYAYAGPGPFVPNEVPRDMGSYYYLPGHGILGEACDLPTSACSNTERANY